jgi:hypothetical protein
MPIIKPITDLQDTDAISELCYNHQEPVFISNKGYGDLVLMSMATYERQLAMSEVFQKLNEAEEQEKNGLPNIDGREVFTRLRERYRCKAV